MAKAKEAATQKLCHSGSGAKTSGGTFAPGGDAKYKSALIERIVGADPTPDAVKAETKRLTDAGYDQEYLSKHAAMLVSKARAKAIIEGRKWQRFLVKRQDVLKTKADAKATREAAKAKAKADKPVKAEKAAKATKAPSTRKAKGATTHQPAAKAPADLQRVADEEKAAAVSA